MEYPWYFCLRENGVITQGPNAGELLQDYIQEQMEDPESIDAIRALAAKHRALEPAIKIEIMRKQYRSRPKRHFHYELVEVYP